MKTHAKQTSACVLKIVPVCPPWHVSVHGEYAVQEDDDAQYRRRDEELSVDTQPGKIQPDLLSKVLPVQRRAVY